MKFACLVLCGVVAVLADVDIFNACPDFRPISNFKFDELTGEWFVLQMVKHFEGNWNLLDWKQGFCVKANITELGEFIFKDKEKSKSSELHEKLLHLSLVNFKKKPEVDELEQLESHNYTFTVNRTNRGLWTEQSSAAFVSVMMVERDFCMLTLCEPEQLISFILSKHRSVNLTMVTEDAYFILEDRELFVDESIIVETCASSTLQSVSAFVLIVVALTAHFH